MPSRQGPAMAVSFLPEEGILHSVGSCTLHLPFALPQGREAITATALRPIMDWSGQTMESSFSLTATFWLPVLPSHELNMRASALRPAMWSAQ